MSDKELVSATITALAAIDAELGLPEDGCNSTARTLTAIRLLHSVHRDDVAEIERLHEQMERGTAALRTAFGPELWQLGHPAYVVVHLREEIERLSAEVARLMAERETERMRLAAWPEIHAERPTWSDLIARLRTTAAALRDMIDRAYLPESLTNARAILAALEQEGLT